MTYARLRHKKALIDYLVWHYNGRYTRYELQKLDKNRLAGWYAKLRTSGEVQHQKKEN